MNVQQARQTPVGTTDGQFKALTNRWKYSPQELSRLNKEIASELLVRKVVIEKTEAIIEQTACLHSMWRGE